MFNIDALLKSTDLAELARRAGSKMKFAYGEWRGNCPIHNGDNETAFVIYESNGRQVYHCFTRSECGGGDAIDFVMKLHHVDFPEACRILGGEEADPQAIAQAARERAQRAEEELKRTIEVAQKALADLQAARAWESYHESMDDHARELWRERGIPDGLQDWWQLGYRPKYTVNTKAGKWNTPSLTIPIFEQGWSCVNVRHRLLNPYSPNDKYRPERAGLGASPFIADPDIGYETDRILVVEGEIKAMVAWLTMDESGLQVVGIPGKGQFNRLADKIRGRQVYICFDPDAELEAITAAQAVGGRLLKLRMKIDDAINGGALDTAGLRYLMKSARRP